MDRAGRSPLHYAALDDDASRVETLLAAGESSDDQDEQGLTPLHMAAQEYSLAAATALLDAGAAVDPTNGYGNTPLWTAVFGSRGRGKMIELLRSRGADPLHVNHHGKTPVGLARLMGNYDVAQSLSFEHMFDRMN